MTDPLLPSSPAKPLPGDKRPGRSSAQMRNAPKRAIYIWPNNDLEYARYQARKQGRSDLQIMPMWVLEDGGKTLRGIEIEAIVIDHACPSFHAAAEPFFRALNEEGIKIIRNNRKSKP